MSHLKIVITFHSAMLKNNYEVTYSHCWEKTWFVFWKIVVLLKAFFSKITIIIYKLFLSFFALIISPSQNVARKANDFLRKTSLNFVKLHRFTWKFKRDFKSNHFYLSRSVMNEATVKCSSIKHYPKKMLHAR